MDIAELEQEHVQYTKSCMLKLFEENINELPSEELEQKRRELQALTLYDDVNQEAKKQIAISELIELRLMYQHKKTAELTQKLQQHQRRLQNMTTEDIEYEHAELMDMNWATNGYIDLVVAPRGK